MWYLQIIFDEYSLCNEEEIRIKVNFNQGKHKWIMTGVLFAVTAIVFLLLNTQIASASGSVYTDKNEIPFSV